MTRKWAKVPWKHTDLKSQFWSSYYPFFGCCCEKMENFRANICFETSEHSVQTADDNSKVISRALQFTLVLYIFKLVLDFNSITNSNQIKYYFAIIEGILK